MIYLDNAATTRIRDEVLESMLPYLKDAYGNPSAGYEEGRRARRALDDARETVRELIGAGSTGEIFFTSSGTESDNWAIKGFLHANAGKEKNFLTSSYEHHAVLETADSLMREGYSVSYINPNGVGSVDLCEFSEALLENTVLSSIMLVNNEIGSINNVAALAEKAHEKGVAFHTDAVQALGHINVKVRELGIDMLSGSAHKFYGPKGTGFIYIKDGIKVSNLLDGGSQERGKRAGTENVAGAVGLATALKLAVEELESEKKRLKDIKRHLAKRLLSEIPCAVINGSVEENVPGIMNVSFIGNRNDIIVPRLDMEGICVSAGAACTAGTTDRSHVLLAVGLPDERVTSAVRISFGRYNTARDADILVESLKNILK